MEKLLVFIFFIFTGCGEGAKTPNAESKKHDEEKVSQVFGDCTVTGDIANFELNCTKG